MRLDLTKIIKFTALQLFLLAIISAAYASAATGEEELAPGFNACMERAANASFDDEADCYKKAGEYQSRRLEAAYKKARKLCDQGENPALCKNELKKMELAWLDFQSRVYTYLLNEGIFGPYNYDNPDVADAIGRAKLYADSFEARETKRQADRLELFYKLWERWQ